MRLFLKTGILSVIILFALQACSKSSNDAIEPEPIKNGVTIANMLQSNMVIQRDKPFLLWGSSSKNAELTISVSWNSTVFTTTASAGSTWSITIPAAPANNIPQTITVAATGEKPIVLENILIGDVWICSGQSNMVMPLAPDGGSFRGVLDYESEVANANYPLIRALTITQNSKVAPAEALSILSSWEVCSPQTAGSFSGIAYYFAKKLHTELNVPVGIIISAVSGTKCQLWANKYVFDNDKALSNEYNKGNATYLYNGMINPLIKLGIKGFIWYQGESNWGDDTESFAKLSAALIGGWRNAFNQGQLPFYYVELAPFAKNHNTEENGGDPSLYDYALFREGQATIKNKVSGTDMAITMDVGEVLNLHPRDKKPVGDRLALFALKNDYGENINTTGPTYKSFVQAGNKVTITFEHAEGLSTISGEAIKQHFFVAQDENEFLQAEAVINGNQIVLTVSNGVTVNAVRYAFTNFAITNLQNGDGLPMDAFRTDSW